MDFNAGVVAAGEAQIESTVTGNDSSFATFEKDIALQDQSQVRDIIHYSSIRFVVMSYDITHVLLFRCTFPSTML